MIYADFYRQFEDMQYKHALCGRLLHSHADYFDEQTKEMFRAEQLRLQQDMHDLVERLEREDIRIGNYSQRQKDASFCLAGEHLESRSFTGEDTQAKCMPVKADTHSDTYLEEAEG